MSAGAVRIRAGWHQYTRGASTVGPLLDIGPDGEIYDDGTFHTLFPPDPELETFDPLEG